MDERELISDAHPRQETTAVEQETELFAKQIDRYLDKARVKGLFDKLHLVAPPKFLGLLRHNLGKETAKRVAEEIDKDLSWFDVRELEKYVVPGKARER
jgi:protein required for attachment to host cells